MSELDKGRGIEGKREEGGDGDIIEEHCEMEGEVYREWEWGEAGSGWRQAGRG